MLIYKSSVTLNRDVVMGHGLKIYPIVIIINLGFGSASALMAATFIMKQKHVFGKLSAF